MKNIPNNDRIAIYFEFRGENENMLSRDCDGCSQMKRCSERYRKVGKGGKVYCPDGTAHLVDEEIIGFTTELCNQCYE